MTDKSDKPKPAIKGKSTVNEMPRKEKDSFGEIEVPDNAYYGAHTARSLSNFNISGQPIRPEIISAITAIKKSACRANLTLGLLEKEKALAIIQACDETLAGKFQGQFQIDVYQAGSGTSTNMNVNEVIANRACEIMGKTIGSKFVHPNDDVNKGQSTNDVIPTAIKLSCLAQSKDILNSLKSLISALESKASEFSGIVKAGRTHLQDAVPVTLGQEFEAYAYALRKDYKRIEEASEFLKELGIGGNAVGTGINAPPKFRGEIVSQLASETGFDLRPTKSGLEGVQFITDIAWFSYAINSLAIDLNKISNDLRLLNSGPMTGLGEITLPPVEPGSSIMPGKINPSIAEAVNMACMRAMGNCLTIQSACTAGQLELNTNMPVVGNCAIESAKTMSGAVKAFSEKCVCGIKANPERCEWYVNNSAALATALNPIIGYDKAAELVKESLETGKGIKELLKEKKLLSEKQIEELFDPKTLTGQK